YMRKCDKYVGCARQLSRRYRRARVTDSGIPVIVQGKRKKTTGVLKERASIFESDDDLNFIGLSTSPNHHNGRKKPTIAHYTRTADNASRFALRIDQFSRVAFPVTFIVFNLT
ncbi:hypothetical protein PMAYCL1PPCAC_15927, partial [Pristionchus mayeri]